MVELGREGEGFREDELLKSVSSYRCTSAAGGKPGSGMSGALQLSLEGQERCYQSTCGFSTLHDN